MLFPFFPKSKSIKILSLASPLSSSSSSSRTFSSSKEHRACARACASARKKGTPRGVNGKGATLRETPFSPKRSLAWRLFFFFPPRLFASPAFLRPAFLLAGSAGHLQRCPLFRLRATCLCRSTARRTNEKAREIKHRRGADEGSHAALLLLLLLLLARELVSPLSQCSPKPRARLSLFSRLLFYPHSVRPETRESSAFRVLDFKKTKKKSSDKRWRRSTRLLCCSAATASSSSGRCSACPWGSSTAPARRPTCSLRPGQTRAGPSR